MAASAAMALRSSENAFSAEVLDSAAAIGELQLQHHSILFGAEGTQQPSFFLASVSDGWKPKAVALYGKGRRLAGLVYAKEKLVWGVRIGIAYIDATLPHSIVAESGRHGEMLALAARALLHRRDMRAVRLLIPADDPAFAEAKQELETVPGIEFAVRSATLHSRLPLPASYEALIERLGKKGRRNFRYYRRKFEAESGEYVWGMQRERFQQAALALSGVEGTGACETKTRRALRMLATVPTPILAGLRGSDGEWLSIVGGWIEGSCATILFQMNDDRRHGRMSLSVVLRGYVLEQLIDQQIKEVFFWAGVGAPLNACACDVATQSLYLDKPSVALRAARLLTRVTRSLLPPKLSYYADWILPDTRLAPARVVARRDET